MGARTTVGKPCKVCGGTERYVGNRDCISCSKVNGKNNRAKARAGRSTNEILAALTKADVERFWSYVSIRGREECWEWLGSKNSKGYGSLGVSGAILKASRISMFLDRRSTYPIHLDALHTCDRPSCVNPAHLFPGTHQDNMTDRNRKGRHMSSRGKPTKLTRLTKLTEAQATEIRVLYAKGGISQLELGRQFGVSRAQIGRIVNKKQWLPPQVEAV